MENNYKDVEHPDSHSRTIGQQNILRGGNIPFIYPNYTLLPSTKLSFISRYTYISIIYEPMACFSHWLACILLSILHDKFIF